MFQKWVSNGAVATLSLLAVACGGGDGGSTAGGATPTPTATATPTPTPTPSPVVDNGRGTISTFAPFGVEGDTEMDVIGLMKDENGTRWITRSDVALTWLAGPRTFALALPGYGRGQVADDPAEEARSAGFLVDSGGQRIAGTNFYIPGNPRDTDRLVLLAFFSPPAKGGAGASGYFHYFARSSVASPTSGQATYAITASLNTPCPGKVSIDFATGTVTGQVCVTYEDFFGPYPATLYDIVDGKYDGETGRIEGRFAIPDSGYEGELSGQVLGSKGEVLSLMVRGAVYDAYYEKKWSEAWRNYELVATR